MTPFHFLHLSLPLLNGSLGTVLLKMTIKLKEEDIRYLPEVGSVNSDRICIMEKICDSSYLKPEKHSEPPKTMLKSKMYISFYFLQFLCLIFFSRMGNEYVLVVNKNVDND